MECSETDGKKKCVFLIQLVAMGILVRELRAIVVRLTENVILKIKARAIYYVNLWKAKRSC